MDPIKIDGLAQFNRNLKKLDADLPKAVRVALNGAAEVITDYAKPRIPKRTGKAARSVKPRSTRTAVRVVGGGNRAPYYPWLDFGGKVGPRKSVSRPFMKEGRYLYAAYHAQGEEFQRVMSEALVDVVRQAGIEVD